MACILEPRLGRNGEVLKWDPANIPSTKPFINIVTSPQESLSTCNDMNFIKTRSLIYSSFHKTARYVNFDIGYSTESKWLEYLKDKWNNYANFFVSGFFEAIYSTKEKNSDVTYAQVDAKLIDYDPRFYNPSNSSQSSKPTSPITNAFSQRRDSFKTKETQQKPSNNSSSTPNTPTPTRRTPNKREEGMNKYFK